MSRRARPAAQSIPRSRAAPEPIAAIYAIYLLGTPFVYVGRTQNVEARWREHRDAWVWPNAARYEIVRLLRDSSVAPGTAEYRAAVELRQRGYLLLSAPIEPVDEKIRRHWREREVATSGRQP